MSYQYEVGDRVALNTKHAYNSGYTDGMLGTVERIEDRPMKPPLYHVVLDEPIKHPDRHFFTHLSQDCRRSTFDPKWLRPLLESERDEEREIDISRII